MAGDDQVASIGDASKPNAGRIYDFVLGGNHNFEVDRIAAQSVLKLGPGFPKLARTIRWFLGEAVRRLVEDGYTQFVDFASGLPTVDHIHEVAPRGTRVVYSDIDPVTVAYGQEIIKDLPEVRYICCDVATPERLFDDPSIGAFLDRGRKTAFGMNGIAWFVKDEDLGHALRVVYDAAEKGSRLFLSDMDSDPAKMNATMKESLDLYKSLGQPGSLRTQETLMRLCQPWKLVAPGLLPLEEWVGVRGGVAEDTETRFGASFYGGIFEK
ncbi:MAG TPA: SAM-dependent methyltransferase [Spirochaetia bacterium]